jgi:hypothetical protein
VAVAARCTATGTTCCGLGPIPSHGHS